ncbi:MAG: acyl-CoA dehydrogenase family protein [Candidatus Cloacimonetes bacterium]|nr:acyl-CoA dehydrogenase family protein [Candidatus Cloacimonadota bacterium]MBL7107750.1 acyl-CoA dehydrogenase family protein [Candidatus Cloacimonadota bacterium]
MILSDKHLKFREKVKQFADNEIAPESTELEKKEKFPWEIIKKMGKSNLLAIYVPKKYGGAGLDTLSYAIAVEEIGRVCGSTGIFLAAHTSLGIYPIFLSGNEEQKKKWLPPLASGEKISSFGLTEPNAGSDAAGTQTTFKLVDDKYLINGTKCFITSGGVGDTIVFTATKDPSLGYKGISAFVVEKGTPGFSEGKREDKLGLRGSITSELIFDNCEIPQENLLGKDGEGFKVFMQTLDGGRISIGALALGIAQGALDACIKFCKSNSINKKPLFKMQSIQSTIAEMGTEIEAARLLVHQAAALKDEGLPITKESAMGKYYASKIGMKATSTAVELHGMLGLKKDYLVERFMRDEKLMEIGEGTSEIQKIVIARELFK